MYNQNNVEMMLIIYNWLHKKDAKTLPEELKKWASASIAFV